jgi:hypothetical protein
MIGWAVDLAVLAGRGGAMQAPEEQPMTRQQEQEPEKKPAWMSDEQWQDHLEELAAWRKRRQRQHGGPEPEVGPEREA